MPDSTSVRVTTANGIRMYSFYRVLSPFTTQENAFDEVKYLIHYALDGNNICIMAYGATGSGKTYTIVGESFNENKESENELNENTQIINYFTNHNYENFGILPRSLIELFTKLFEFERFNGIDVVNSDNSNTENSEIFNKELSKFIVECFFIVFIYYCVFFL
jgi:Cdc6-like AAA superfamily ATPase